MYLKQIFFILCAIMFVSSELQDIEDRRQIDSVTNSIDILKHRMDMMELNFKTKYGDLETKYLNILEKWENAKKSDEALKSNVDVMADQISKLITTEEAKVKFLQNPIFDARVDLLPEHCRTNKLPFDCKEATKCTKKSGYYEILASNNRNHTFEAFCDEETVDGDWLHILRRIDGSENFTRNWSDYVNGFGKVDSDYWIGLENLYELTNYNGQQELYIYIENFKGESRFARYDNFVIGNATEKYKLKSLGEYSGTAWNDFYENINMSFSTYDSDNDVKSGGNCADVRKGGFWFKNCGYINPTGTYFHGSRETIPFEGVFWYEFGGVDYSHKIMNFMIRTHRKEPSLPQSNFDSSMHIIVHRDYDTQNYPVSSSSRAKAKEPYLVGHREQTAYLL